MSWVSTSAIPQRNASTLESPTDMPGGKPRPHKPRTSNTSHVAVLLSLSLVTAGVSWLYVGLRQSVHQQQGALSRANVIHAYTVAPGRHASRLHGPPPGGLLFSWGLDSAHRLARSGGDATHPAPAATRLAWAAAAASRHSLLLSVEGVVWSAGFNDSAGGGGGGSTPLRAVGQLGRGGGSSALGRVEGLPVGVAMASIAVGRYHSLAADSQGRVYTWGLNDWGQLGRQGATALGPGQPGAAAGGRGSSKEVPCTSGARCHSGRPGLVTALSGHVITAVAAGRYSSFALDAAGRVWAWGYEACANGGSLPSPAAAWKPRRVGGQLAGQRVTALSAGYTFWVAATASGAAYTCAHGDDGYAGTLPSRPAPNAVGQLGRGGPPSRPGRLEVPQEEVVVGVAAGREHGLAVTAGGRVWSWGGSEVTAGRSGDLRRPELVEGGLAGEVVLAVAAGEYYSLAATGTTLYGWGSNAYTTTGTAGASVPQVARPTRVQGLLGGQGWNISRLAAGYQHAFAVAAKEGKTHPYGVAEVWEEASNSSSEGSVTVVLPSPAPGSSSSNSSSITRGMGPGAQPQQQPQQKQQQQQGAVVAPGLPLPAASPPAAAAADGGAVPDATAAVSSPAAVGQETAAGTSPAAPAVEEKEEEGPGEGEGGTPHIPGSSPSSGSPSPVPVTGAASSSSPAPGDQLPEGATAASQPAASPGPAAASGGGEAAGSSAADEAAAAGDGDGDGGDGGGDDELIPQVVVAAGSSKASRGGSSATAPSPDASSPALAALPSQQQQQAAGSPAAGDAAAAAAGSGPSPSPAVAAAAGSQLGGAAGASSTTDADPTVADKDSPDGAGQPSASPGQPRRLIGFDHTSYLAPQAQPPTYNVSGLWAAWTPSPLLPQLAAVAPDVFQGLPRRYSSTHAGACWRGEEGGARLKCLPSFNIIGVSKCGTTDLYSRLTKHPLIPAAFNKGPHFWDECGVHPAATCNWLQYISLFNPAAARAASNPSILTGEASSNTFTSANRVYLRGLVNKEPALNVSMPLLLREAQPYLRLVLLLRDPVERYQSAFYYYRWWEKGKPVPTPDQFHDHVVADLAAWRACLHKGSTRLTPGAVTNTNSTTNSSSSSAEEGVLAGCVRGFHPQQLVKGMYSEFLQDWLSTWPRQQLLIVRYEDYIADTPAHLAAVLTFLGAPRPEPEVWEAMVAAEVKNKNKRGYEVMRSDTRALLQQHYAPFNARLAAALADGRYGWGLTEGAGALQSQQ